MSTPAELSANLSRNLRHLRELRRITQAQLAQASGVPRGTIAALEAGDANPTLAVLAQLAQGLQVNLSELLGPPRDFGRLYKAGTLPTRETRGVTFQQVMPDPLPGLTIERMCFPPRSRVTGIPHTAGSREYLCCEQGRVVLTTETHRWELEAGDVVVYRGDQSHGYHNPHPEPAVVLTVIAAG